MSRIIVPVALLLLLLLMTNTGVTELPRATSAEEWPQWRGPLGNGVAPHADPPVRWNEVNEEDSSNETNAQNENIRWKIRLPGRGHSTPVIWKKYLFVTSAVPQGESLKPRYSDAPGAHDNLPVTQRHRFMVLAIDRRDGSVLWQQRLHERLPHEGGHFTGSLASHSAVTDGEHVIAMFGSTGLFCLDHAGNLVWKKDLGLMRSKHGHGEGSSPVLFEDTVVVNWDHEGQSYLLALEKQTGAPKWKVARDEVTSWSTPIIIEQEGKMQVIVNGTQRVRAYDLASGEVMWECGGLSANIVASPVAGNGMVFVGSSYSTRNLLAIRLAGARGDITHSDHVTWSRRQGTPYVPSPLLYGEGLYFLRHYQGVMTRVHAATGEEQPGAFRLGGIHDVYASPVGAAGRIYVTGRNGTTIVISNGEIPRLLAVNRLNDSFSASAALVKDAMYLRGDRYLYCLGHD